MHTGYVAELDVLWKAWKELTSPEQLSEALATKAKSFNPKPTIDQINTYLYDRNLPLVKE